jgi:hypothetical protein
VGSGDSTGEETTSSTCSCHQCLPTKPSRACAVAVEML